MSAMLCAGILQIAILTVVSDNTTVPNIPDAPKGATANKESVPVGTTAAETYVEAHRQTTENGKPMVVMVGTDWCGPCQMMKKTILPRVRELGLFRRVAFAVVNADRDRELAQSLTGGGPIPQLVMFRKTPDGWMRRKLVGGQSVEEVEKFINDGLALEDADKDSKKKAASEEPTSESSKPASHDQTTSYQPEAATTEKTAHKG
jgi:thioredoxin-like negative regulator of GroEL